MDFDPSKAHLSCWRRSFEATCCLSIAFTLNHAIAAGLYRLPSATQCHCHKPIGEFGSPLMYHLQRMSFRCKRSQLYRDILDDSKAISTGKATHMQ